MYKASECSGPQFFHPENELVGPRRSLPAQSFHRKLPFKKTTIYSYLVTKMVLKSWKCVMFLFVGFSNFLRECRWRSLPSTGTRDGGGGMGCGVGGLGAWGAGGRESLTETFVDHLIGNTSA